MSPRIAVALLCVASLVGGKLQAQHAATGAAHFSAPVHSGAPAHIGVPVHPQGRVAMHGSLPGAATSPSTIGAATGPVPFHTINNNRFNNGFHHCRSGFNCHGNRPGYSNYYPYYGYPLYYGDSGYVDNSAEQPVNYEGAENAPSQQTDQTQDQLAKLTYEVEQLRADQHSALEKEKENQQQNDAAPDAAPKDLGTVTPTVLVFSDGHQMQVNNYALVGRTVWVLSDHAATQKIPLAQLDIPATVKANADNGVEFSVP